MDCCEFKCSQTRHITDNSWLCGALYVISLDRCGTTVTWIDFQSTTAVGCSSVSFSVISRPVQEKIKGSKPNIIVRCNHTVTLLWSTNHNHGPREQNLIRIRSSTAKLESWTTTARSHMLLPCCGNSPASMLQKVFVLMNPTWVPQLYLHCWNSETDLFFCVAHSHISLLIYMQPI